MLRVSAYLLTVSVLSSFSAAWGFETPESPAELPATIPLEIEPRSEAAESTPATDPKAPRNPRVLYISMKGCPACVQQLARLRRPGGDFDGMRAKGWKIGTTPDCHVQIVDREQIPELIARFNIQSFPTVICIKDQEIVRSFSSGCTTPLDSWTFGFLLSGKNERPPGSISEAARVAWTGSYPLRGNHWSVEGDWNPSRDKVVSHLRTTHGTQVTATYAIDTWSIEELKSLHDDLHEKESGAGVSTGYASTAGYYPPQPRSTNFMRAGHKMGF
jgi:hypothetical protein